MAKIERAYKIDLRKKGIKDFLVSLAIFRPPLESFFPLAPSPFAMSVFFVAREDGRPW